jgi:hypothetical protein
VREHRYRILLAGRLGDAGRSALGGLALAKCGPNTVVTGDLDQAGLYGVLARIQNLNLELLSLTRLDRARLAADPAAG